MIAILFRCLFVAVFLAVIRGVCVLWFSFFCVIAATQGPVKSPFDRVFEVLSRATPTMLAAWDERTLQKNAALADVTVPETSSFSVLSWCVGTVWSHCGLDPWMRRACGVICTDTCLFFISLFPVDCLCATPVFQLCGVAAGVLCIARPLPSTTTLPRPVCCPHPVGTFSRSS